MSMAQPFSLTSIECWSNLANFKLRSGVLIVPDSLQMYESTRHQLLSSGEEDLVTVKLGSCQG